MLLNLITVLLVTTLYVALATSLSAVGVISFLVIAPALLLLNHFILKGIYNDKVEVCQSTDSRI